LLAFLYWVGTALHPELEGQRYINLNPGRILFSSGAILVEWELGGDGKARK